MKDEKGLMEIPLSEVVSVLLSDGWHPTEDFQLARCGGQQSRDRFTIWQDVAMWHEAGIWIVCPANQIQAIKKKIERPTST